MCVSIVIPARNEAADIRETIECCLALDHEPKEVIVVDDSTDDTPAVVAEYADRGVRLLHRERNENGCCGARNLGMKSSRGEIVVLMNADDRPAPDFLRQILDHYEAGADFVVVDSQVKNPEDRWACWIHASHLAANYEDPHWSEGFSCRAEAGRTVGFIPGDFPVNFCRDVLFGQQLAEAGYRKVFDRSIKMPHLAPRSAREFWGNRVWRGTFSAPYQYYVQERSLSTVIAREGLRGLRSMVFLALLFPVLVQAARLSAELPDGRRRFPHLSLVSAVARAAEIVGGIRGTRALIRAVRGAPARPAPSDADEQRGAAAPGPDLRA